MKIISFISKQKLGVINNFMPTLHQKTLTGLLLFCILFLTFWIRIQGVRYLPEGASFTTNDAHLYHWQAKIIAEHGKLPARDMHRWLPLGRDNTQLLSLYAYAIAYIHKVFPWWSLYQIQLYLPVICFTLGLGVLFLFLARTFGVVIGSIVALLLATLPGSIERSAAGFGDRDAWCWMLGTFAVTCYLWKEQMAPGHPRRIATLLSGFIVFLGGLSWEAFGLFVLIVLAVELWKFCTTDTEQDLKEYILYIFMFVPWLYLISPAYSSGYGHTTHLFALTLLPPVAVFALRGLRALILKFYPLMQPHARKVAGGLTLLGIAVGAGYIFLQYDAFETTAFTVFESQLMKNVGELADPHFGYWYRRYGTIFILGSFGWIAASLYFWKWKGLPLACSLALFTATTFFRDPFANWIGDSSCNMLFLVSLGTTAVALAVACCRKEQAAYPANNGDKRETLLIERATLAILAWFLLWVALARGGKRYDFFIGFPLAYGTVWLLWFSSGHLLQTLKDAKILSLPLKERHITAMFTIAVLILVLFWAPLGGHLTRASYAAAKMRKPTLRHETPLERALTWIKNTLPEDTVVAANWGYGSRLNIFGGVKTIIDQDHYLPYWIEGYYRHVFCAQSEREALEFLKTHKATHLMLTKRGVTVRAADYSVIGSENNDRKFAYTPLLLLPDERLSSTKHTPFLYIDLIDLASPPNALTAHLKNGDIAQLPYVVFQGTQRHIYKTANDDAAHGGVILYYTKNGYLKKAEYIPTAGWNSLAHRLYFRGELPDIFVPIYPINGDDTADFKIWKIHYPPDIQPNPKYLKTGFPEIDTQLQLQ